MALRFTAAVILAALTALAAQAQGKIKRETVSKAFRIKVENRAQLLRKLQQESMIKRMKWQQELNRRRDALMDSMALSKNVKLSVQPDVVLAKAEDGKEEMNLSVVFSYETLPDDGVKINVGNQTDDYPAGAYIMTASKACKLTCEFLKTKLEGDMLQYFKPGRKVSIKITGATDGTPINAKIRYGGEYGEYQNKLVYLNGSTENITVTKQSGITTNAQLAFLRTQGVKDFLENYVNPLQETKNRFQIYAVENKEKGGQYRRIDIEVIIHGAYDEEMEALPDAQADKEEIAAVSDVDQNLPAATAKHDDLIALIIANEKYDRRNGGIVAEVPFAQNDGKSMSEYVRKVIGVEDPEQVKVLYDATMNQMRDGFDWLRNVAASYKGKAKVLVYYSGHGMPNVQTNCNYIMPIDANPQKPSQMFSLKELFDELGKMQAEQVVCMFDACFSGTKKNGDMIVEGTRGVSINIKQDVMGGNVVVFSAANAMQSAYPYREQKHGMFTYYLLKALQESAANISLGDLFNKVQGGVERKCSLKSFEQSPTFEVSPQISDKWRELKLF